MNTWKPPAADKPGWTKPRKERLLWGLYVSVLRTVHPCHGDVVRLSGTLTKLSSALRPQRRRRVALLCMSQAHRGGRQQGSTVVPQAADEGGCVQMTGDHPGYGAVIKAGGPRHTGSSIDAAGAKVAAGAGR